MVVRTDPGGVVQSVAIDPAAIPGRDLDPERVRAAAEELRRAGVTIRDRGAEARREWQRLADSYEAPEAWALIGALSPVEHHSREFGDALEVVAVALTMFAEEAQVVRTGLDDVRRDAWAFRRRVDADPRWREKQHLVDENTMLVGRVNVLQARLWEAERDCANGIVAQYGGSSWHAMTGDGDPRGYGVTELPTTVGMPWGSEVHRTDACPRAAFVQTKRFVWDGLLVDGVGGTVIGMGALVGIDGNGWSWQTVTTTWGAVAELADPFSTIGALRGNTVGSTRDAWTEVGRGVIAYDTWDQDPARAAGASLFNLGSMIIPIAGPAAKASQAASAAGRTGRTASLLTRATRIVDLTDPLALAAGAGRVAVPRLAELMRLGSGFDLPDAADLRLPDAPTGPLVTVANEATPSMRAADDSERSALDDPSGGAVRADEAREPAPVGGRESAGETYGGPGSDRDGGRGGGDPWQGSESRALDEGPVDPEQRHGSADGDGTVDCGGRHGDAGPASDPDGATAAGPSYDILHGGAERGDGWARETDEPIDPDHDRARSDAGHTAQNTSRPPDRVSSDVKALGGDLSEPWGRDAFTGQPLTEDEWVARYVREDGSLRWPPNGGAVPGTRVEFYDSEAFVGAFGNRLDRVGDPDGTYFGTPPGTPWIERSLPPHTLASSVHHYELDTAAAARADVRVHVSRTAPAFGRPGGGVQVYFTRNGEPLSVDDLIDLEVIS